MDTALSLQDNLREFYDNKRSAGISINRLPACSSPCSYNLVERVQCKRTARKGKNWRLILKKLDGLKTRQNISQVNRLKEI
uniref:Transposase n=1 Tax=Heterorhabditis bacteriophora TaxID=37862 RepID=A0A1I7XFK6_HETBA